MMDGSNNDNLNSNSVLSPSNQHRGSRTSKPDSKSSVPQLSLKDRNLLPDLSSHSQFVNNNLNSSSSRA